MTEKRFTIDVLDENNWLIQDTKTGENANPIDGTTNVLKGLISTLNKFNDENEQLKSTINTLTHDNTKMKKVLNTTKKENEQIKHLIKEAYNNERTQLGKSVLKQLLEAIQ